MAMFWGFVLIVFSFVGLAGVARLLYRKWIDGGVMTAIGIFGVTVAFMTLAYMYLWDY